jgi:PKD repeat protein
MGWGQDFDALISPIVTYTVASDYTMTPPATTMCLGTALTFTNTTTPSALLGNRMYSFNAFNAYWGLEPDSTTAWDMGDLSPIQWTTNAAYTYPAAGTFNASLYTLAGFWNSCVDIKTTALTVTPNAVASYTQNTSATPSIAFTSTSTGAVTYSWDFGDGSALDNTANPSHTFAPGTWTVTLTVTSAGGCNTNTTTQTVTVLALDIANSSTGILNVYPNPSSTGLFTIETGTISKTSIEIYNMMGVLVFSKEFTSSTASLNLSAISTGVYSMRVNTNDKHTMKQIVIEK